MNLTAKSNGSYRNKKGNIVFRYTVAGTPEALAKYKESQGDFYREDEETKKPIYFSSRFVGDNAKLIITSNGNVVPDMSEFDKAASLATQFGGNLGQELARAAAHKLMGGAPTNETAPVQEPVNHSVQDPEAV